VKYCFAINLRFISQGQLAERDSGFAGFHWVNSGRATAAKQHFRGPARLA